MQCSWFRGLWSSASTHLQNICTDDAGSGEAVWSSCLLSPQWNSSLVGEKTLVTTSVMEAALGCLLQKHVNFVLCFFLMIWPAVQTDTIILIKSVWYPRGLTKLTKCGLLCHDLKDTTGFGYQYPNINSVPVSSVLLKLGAGCSDDEMLNPLRRFYLIRGGGIHTFGPLKATWRLHPWKETVHNTGASSIQLLLPIIESD